MVSAIGRGNVNRSSASSSGVAFLRICAGAHASAANMRRIAASYHDADAPTA